MTPIHFLHRRINYDSKAINRKKCEASLCHSGRITSSNKTNVKQFEWNESLSDNNLVWRNGQVQQLDSYSTTGKWELLFDIAPEESLRHQSKLKAQLRQYRLKMKKAIAKEEDKGNIEAASFLQQVLDEKGHVSYSKIDTFSEMTMLRRNQRIKMLEKYLNAHNQLCYRVPSVNAVYVQEGIFKIPHKWNIGADVISLEEYISFTVKFLTEHFPDFEIKAVFGHDDERSEVQNTGLHTHYYISGKNSKTGAYDLHKQQIQVVNQYLKRNGRDDETLPLSMSHQQSTVYGHYFQEMVLDYTNEHLLNPKGLHAEFTDETEKKSEQYRKMNQQAKLPKREREFNLYNMQMEQLQRQFESLQKETISLDVKKAKLKALLESALASIQEADHLIKKQQEELANLSAEQQARQDNIDMLGMRYLSMESSIETKRIELEQVEGELEQATKALKEVDVQTRKMVEKTIENVFMLLVARAKGNQALVRKYTDKLASSVDMNIPTPLEPIMTGALSMAEVEVLL